MPDLQETAKAYILMLDKINIWAHRLWMIFTLPLVIAAAIIIGPIIGLEIAYLKFKEYWE